MSIPFIIEWSHRSNILRNTIQMTTNNKSRRTKKNIQYRTKTYTRTQARTTGSSNLMCSCSIACSLNQKKKRNNNNSCHIPKEIILFLSHIQIGVKISWHCFQYITIHYYEWFLSRFVCVILFVPFLFFVLKFRFNFWFLFNFQFTENLNNKQKKPNSYGIELKN